MSKLGLLRRGAQGERKFHSDRFIKEVSMNKNVIIGGVLITASTLNTLLDALYTIVLDYRDTGKGPMGREYKEHLSQMKEQLNHWKTILPSLVPAVNSGIRGGDQKIVDLVNLGQEIKKEFSVFRRNEEFTAQELDILQAAGLYLRNDSATAYKKLERLAGTVSNWAASQMVPELRSQAAVEPALKKIVKSLTGRDDVFLSLEESKAAKLAQPDQYAEYLALAREFNKSWADAFVAYVRNHKDKLVPYQEVLDFLDQQGYKYRLVKGFVGLVDDQRRLYTMKGELIDGVPAAVTSPTVEMNPKVSAAAPWIFKAIKANGAAPTYFYTADFKRSRAMSKFELVRSVEKKIPAARKKWLAKVKSFKTADKESVVCAVLETLYQTSGRIGSRNNPTFGIATLLVKHLTITPNGDIKLSYKGKDGVRNRHELRAKDPEQKWIVPVLISLADGKEPSEPLFSMDNGRQISPAAVNNMFKTLVGSQEVTVHKLRHFKGTGLWNKLLPTVLEKIGPSVARTMEKNVGAAERLAMQHFVKMAEKVGSLLNHVRRGGSGDKVTGATALMNYIDPVAQRAFWRALNLRPPRQLEKLLKE